MRRNTVSVNVGGVIIGSSHPIRLQSMTNTTTTDIEASVAQCESLAHAGAEIVRLTAQGTREAIAIGEIRRRLREKGCDVPLVADIHFNPAAALEAAKVTDKVRINPGNFVDPARTFKNLEYTDGEYAAELDRIEQGLLPLIDLCRQHGTALRLGVNHGSLSDRIMSRYGNTAAGMVQSVMEYLHVLVKHDFMQVVISMKASNVVVMVEAVRRLVDAMDAEGMRFPLHLGVTEAGFGEDGRVKSAVGIGALLMQGYGDTIRVSLSEQPESEIPVARKLVEHVAQQRPCGRIQPVERKQGKRPVVIAKCMPQDLPDGATLPDYFYTPEKHIDDDNPNHRYLVSYYFYKGHENTELVFASGETIMPIWNKHKGHRWVIVDTEDVDRVMTHLKRSNHDFDANPVDFIVTARSDRDRAGMLFAAAEMLNENFPTARVVPHLGYDESDLEMLQVKAGADAGAVLLAGRGDGLWIENDGSEPATTLDLSFAILQAARLRTTRTEFISCPGCGRTLFDLQTTVKRVKDATAHLTHLKIAVMGCIVNGPGEMADADYGYVGAGPGRVSLYKGKQCVTKNIPQEDAIERLLELINENEKS